MAKTIMISNMAYEELKKLKEESKSFSDVVIELIESKKANTGHNLWKHFGVLRGDEEYDKIKKELKKGWLRWQRRYA